MYQKLLLFLKRKNHNFYFLSIPLLVLSLLAIITLVLTAEYNMDVKIAEKLARALEYDFFKYLTTIYEYLGNSELIVILIIYLAILLEFWFYKKSKTNTTRIKNKYWLINVFYVLVIILWFISYLFAIYCAFNENNGFGKGIYFRLLTNIKYKIVALIVVFIYQTSALIIGLIWVKYYLIKKPTFFTNNLKFKIIGSIVFGIITYSIIIVLKGTTSRLYYYNVIFGDLLKQHPQLINSYLKSGFRYGFDSGQGYIDNIPQSYQYPWWKATAFFNVENKMPKFDFAWEYAFPSGHINATYCSGSILLLFINYNYKITWKLKLCYLIWLCHLITMNFALVIARFHWISDTAFTFVLSTIMLFIINTFINKKAKIIS